MTRRLTDKVKTEIVKKQIEFLKNKYPSNLIKYSILKNDLTEAINGYLTETFNRFPVLTNGLKELNKKVDFLFLKNLEREAGAGSVSRIWQASRLWEDVKRGKYPTNLKLVEFYKKAEKDLSENKYKSFSIRNYGLRSHKLLETYLIQKGLID